MLKINNIEFVVATGRAYYEALPALKKIILSVMLLVLMEGIVYNKNEEIISITPIQVKRFILYNWNI